MHDDYGTTYEERAQNAENKVARLEARLAKVTQERDALQALLDDRDYILELAASRTADSATGEPSSLSRKEQP